MLTPETMLIVAGAAFLLFGGKKLPELGRSLGDGIREFRSGTQGLKADVESSVSQPVTPVAAQAVQVPAAGAVHLTAPVGAPTMVILPSAPVTHITELGRPLEHEAAVPGSPND
ncbi:Sec-independent protein translocase subunit TatA/TatB [Deinococcus sp. UYEF24]